MITLAHLNALPTQAAVDGLLACCGSRRWAEDMAQQRPFAALGVLQAAADAAFTRLRDGDWQEAFAAHPRIGERSAAKATAAAWSRQEQAGVDGADAAARTALAAGNEAYFERFGFIFLICATGKSAGDMVASLQERMHHSRAEELAWAAREQQKITHLRLKKWVQA